MSMPEISTNPRCRNAGESFAYFPYVGGFARAVHPTVGAEAAEYDTDGPRWLFEARLHVLSMARDALAVTRPASVAPVPTRPMRGSHLKEQPWQTKSSASDAATSTS